MSRNVFATSMERLRANRLGLWLFLCALAILFGAALLVVLSIRLQAHGWPRDLPPLPSTLWVSTGVLLAAGLAMQWAVIASKCQQMGELRLSLVVALLLALFFLVLQSMAWFQWTEAVEELGVLREEHRLAETGFMVLTGLHAAHVIGGLVPLGLVAWLAIARGVVPPSLPDTTIYWHFLSVIWICLVLFMLFML